MNASIYWLVAFLGLAYLSACFWLFFSRQREVVRREQERGGLLLQSLREPGLRNVSEAVSVIQIPSFLLRPETLGYSSGSIHQGKGEGVWR